METWYVPVIQPANPLAPDMHSAKALSEISSPESFVAIAAKVCPQGKQSSAQIFNYAGIDSRHHSGHRVRK
jgi:hypothetical protein